MNTNDRTTSKRKKREKIELIFASGKPPLCLEREKDGDMHLSGFGFEMFVRARFYELYRYDTFIGIPDLPVLSL